jgi:DNA-binding transcriptional LysR family regulator
MDTLKAEAFLRSVELGSIMAAAEDLGYTPSGLNRMINSLEEELDTKLLQRGRNGVALTPAGEELLPMIREFVIDGNAVLEKCSDMNGLISGRLVVGSYYCVAAEWLPGIISGFLEKYPGIDIDIAENSTVELSRALMTSRINCCFMSAPDISVIPFTPLTTDPIVAWLPMDNPYAKNETFLLEKISEFPYIEVLKGTETDAERVLKRLNISPKIKYTTRDQFTAYCMVNAGLGIVLNNSLVTRNWHLNVATLPIEPSADIMIGIAVPPYTKPSPATKKFIQFTQDYMQRNNIISL